MYLSHYINNPGQAAIAQFLLCCADGKNKEYIDSNDDNGFTVTVRNGVLVESTTRSMYESIVVCTDQVTIEEFVIMKHKEHFEQASVSNEAWFL